MSYREFTVSPWGDDEEIMVHEEVGTGKLIHAYAAKKDVERLLTEWADHHRRQRDAFLKAHVGKPTKNPLFVELTQRFLDDFKPQLEQAISDAKLVEAHEEERMKKLTSPKS